MAFHRRDFLKGSVFAAASLVLAQPKMALAGSKDPALSLKAAGYPYDHVKAFMMGDAEVEGCEIAFEVDKIGDLNKHVFSEPQTRGVTEIGLGPFMLGYANDDFRAYSLIPVFPLRTFRHKSIFVHADSGIDHPSQLRKV